MPKKIVVCCDGTDNEFGSRNTNVVCLIQVLAGETTMAPVVYYDPGIGTMPEPSLLTRAGRTLDRRLDQMFATRLKDKVERAYCYLADVWEPGDDVFLFGFSRGAYTVRVLAGLLHSLGLLPPHSDNLVPYAQRLYASLRGKGNNHTYWHVCDAFRATFARAIEGKPDRRFPIHFLGVWDTVSSVGWVWDPATFPYTAKNSSIKIARHAIALDERRAFFRQNHLHADVGGDVQERWFAGVHSDIGGGYALEDGGSWHPSFAWLLGEAAVAGLPIDHSKLEAMVLTSAASPDWQAPLHESLKGLWHVAELVPKLPYSATTGRRSLHLGLGRPRSVPAGSLLHASLVERIHRSSYRPRNLSGRFVDGIKGLLPTGDVSYVP